MDFLNHKQATMIFHNISDYLSAKQAWQDAPAQISPDGAMKVFVKGVWVSAAEFAAHNSKPRYEHPPSPGNPDSTHIPKGVIPMKGGKAAKMSKSP